MAVTVIETNNKLIRFTQEINREFVRENMFSPYMSEGLNAVIRIRSELKAGGEDMNIPLVTRLTGAGVATQTLVGNEEKIDNYGMRLRMEWARNAVVTTKAESHKDSADIFGEAKPLLSDWGKELQRDEIIAALMALPTETLPTSSGGVRVNGIQYDLSTVAQRNTWRADNLDRILYGAAVSNSVTDHATSLLNVDVTADKFTATNLSLMKRVAKLADPHIRPYRTTDGYEYYIACAGTNTFRDLKISLETINKDARPRERSGPYGATDNPIFQDGDQIYDGVIVREIPEISRFVGTAANPGPWGPLLLTAGAASARVEPVFLLGQQAAVFGWGQMAKPTFRKEDDYGFITGVGIEMAYGVGKMFKKHPYTGTALKQWGMVTGFFASSSD
jgi:N4-gp56 family major capsid protein